MVDAPMTILPQEADEEVKFKRVGQPRERSESDGNDSEKEENAEEANTCKKEQLANWYGKIAW